MKTHIGLIALYLLGITYPGAQELEINVSTNAPIVRGLITVSWNASRTNMPPSGSYIVLYPADEPEDATPIRGFPKYTARTSRPTKIVIIGVTGEYEFRHVRRVSGGFFSSSIYETLARSEKIVVREPVTNPSDITNFPYNGSGTTIVALGDSETFGIGSTVGEDYVSELTRRLGCPTPNIINAGVSGDTTADALARLDTDVLAHNPSGVIVWLGANDARLRVPIETTYTNLSQIVNQIHDTGAIVILVGFYQRETLSLFQNRFLELESTIERVAMETGCAYVPNMMYGLIGNYRMMSDAVHPNDSGYEIIAKRLVSAVDTLLKTPEPLVMTAKLMSGNVQISFRLVPGRRYEILANDSLPLSTGIARVWGDGNFIFEVVPEGQQFFYGARSLHYSEELESVADENLVWEEIGPDVAEESVPE